MRALMVNEFTGPRWNKPDLSHPGVLLGQSLLNTYNFSGHYWQAASVCPCAPLRWTQMANLMLNVCGHAAS